MGSVHIQVAARLWEQLPDPLNLLQVFCHVGLHIKVGDVTHQSPRHLELLRRGSDGEARRHGVRQAPFAMPACNQGSTVAIGRRRRVAQRRRRVSIHHDLARDAPHTLVKGRLHQGIDGRGMDRWKDTGGGRALSQERMDEQLRHGLCMLGIGHAQLGGKRVRVQPVQQLRAPGAHHIQLRAVHMRVNKARQDQAASLIDQLPVRSRCMPLGSHNSSMLDQEPMVRAMSNSGGARVVQGWRTDEVHQIAAQGHTGCRRRAGTGHDRILADTMCAYG